MVYHVANKALLIHVPSTPQDQEKLQGTEIEGATFHYVAVYVKNPCDKE